MYVAGNKVPNIQKHPSAACASSGDTRLLLLFVFYIHIIYIYIQEYRKKQTDSVMVNRGNIGGEREEEFTPTHHFVNSCAPA